MGFIMKKLFLLSLISLNIVPAFAAALLPRGTGIVRTGARTLARITKKPKNLFAQKTKLNSLNKEQDLVVIPSLAGTIKEKAEAIQKEYVDARSAQAQRTAYEEAYRKDPLNVDPNRYVIEHKEALEKRYAEEEAREKKARELAQFIAQEKALEDYRKERQPLIFSVISQMRESWKKS